MRRTDVQPQSLDFIDVLEQTALDNVPWWDFMRRFEIKKVFNFARQTRPYDVTPQSSELGSTVKFEDSQGQTRDALGQDITSGFNSIMESDTELAQFFNRPVKIGEFTWTQGVTFSERFDPWFAFLSDSLVANRLARFRLMTADSLEIEFRLNGTSFHYGRLLASYLPLDVADNMNVIRSFLTVDAVAASQRPHLYLDPCEGIGGTLCVPFFWPKGAVDLTSTDSNQLGRIDILQLNPLRRVTAGSAEISISVWARVKGLKLAVPTAANPAFISPQSDEYSDGSRPITRLATSIARWSGYATKIPVIGTYARATQIGATALGQVASLFGYSSPPLLQTQKYRPETVTSLANTNLDSEVSRLTLDAKQELTIDPRIVGLPPDDELSLAHIAQKESYLTTFTWSESSSSEALLYSMRIDPGLHQILNNEKHMTACCYAAQPFQYWKGDMIVRLQAIASKFHRGRIRVVYEPTTTTADPSYNTVLNEVYDLAETKDMTLRIGWGQEYAYAERIPVGLYTDTIDMFRQVTPLPTSPYGNGVLSVYVVNTLATPDDTIASPVEFNVFVKAADNIQFSGPTSDVVSRLRLSQQTVSPQSQELGNTVPETTPETEMLQSPDMTDGSNLEYFGEEVSSFRTLLKRWNYSFFVGENNSSTSLLAVTMPVFPFYRGYQPFSNPIVGISSGLAGGTYLYGPTTMLNYVGMCFAARRGGIQYLFNFASSNSTLSTVGRLSNESGRIPRYEILPYNVATTEPHDSEYYGVLTNQFADLQGMNGMALQAKSVNPVLVTEFPWYSNRKFYPSRTRSVPASSVVDDDQYWQYVSELTSVSPADRGITKVYTRGGEDLTFHFWVGPPIVYYEASAPLS